VGYEDTIFLNPLNFNLLKKHLFHVTSLPAFDKTPNLCDIRERQGIKKTIAK
jgi:hypothetical protein